MPPDPALDSILAALDVGARRVADGEWGLTVDVAGGPLHVGVAVRDGLLRAQAQVLPAGALEPHDVLHRNRGLALVRFAETRAGELWIVGDVPASAVDEALLDRLLGTLVQAATDARLAARGAQAARRTD